MRRATGEQARLVAGFHHGQPQVGGRGAVRLSLGLDAAQVPAVIAGKDWCWYPSAGLDFRDLLYYHPDALRQDGVQISAPELFVHTDYDRRFFDELERAATTGQPIYEDATTKVQVLSRCELRVAAGVRFDVSPAFATWPDRAFSCARALHLHLRITTDTLAEFERDVLYFFFENVNFLEEIVLRGEEQVAHIFKRVDGIAFGGNRKSISFVYALLGVLGTQTIYVDSSVPYKNAAFVCSRPLLDRAIRTSRSVERSGDRSASEPATGIRLVELRRHIYLDQTLYRVDRTGRPMDAEQIARVYAQVGASA